MNKIVITFLFVMQKQIHNSFVLKKILKTKNYMEFEK